MFNNFPTSEEAAYPALLGGVCGHKKPVESRTCNETAISKFFSAVAVHARRL